MKKLLVVGLAVLLSAGVAFACEPGDPGCGQASGNFKLNTLAIGGGIDADGALSHHGAAGGISGAGGLTIGQASGEVFTINVPTLVNGPYIDSRGRNKNGYHIEWLPKAGGEVKASISTIGGGMTRTEEYRFHEDGIKGVGTRSDSLAQTGAKVDVSVKGIGCVDAAVFGIAGEGSANGSVMFNHGISTGLVGQYAVGGFVGNAGAVGYGSAGFNAEIDMAGQSYSESYRGTFRNDDGSKTQVLGSNVGAFTQVNSIGTSYDNGLANGFVTGGWQAGGAATTTTVMSVNGGTAVASATGSYSGSGDLGCNFQGQAEGYSNASATTMKGYNGAIMTSSAGMSVIAKGTSTPPSVK